MEQCREECKAFFTVVWLAPPSANDEAIIGEHVLYIVQYTV